MRPSYGLCCTMRIFESFISVRQHVNRNPAIHTPCLPSVVQVCGLPMPFRRPDALAGGAQFLLPPSHNEPPAVKWVNPNDFWNLEHRTIVVYKWDRHPHKHHETSQTQTAMSRMISNISRVRSSVPTKCPPETDRRAPMARNAWRSEDRSRS
jgi:hypothetical protein